MQLRMLSWKLAVEVRAPMTLRLHLSLSATEATALRVFRCLHCHNMACCLVFYSKLLKNMALGAGCFGVSMWQWHLQYLSVVVVYDCRNAGCEFDESSCLCVFILFMLMLCAPTHHCGSLCWN